MVFYLNLKIAFDLFPLWFMFIPKTVMSIFFRHVQSCYVVVQKIQPTQFALHSFEQRARWDLGKEKSCVKEVVNGNAIDFNNPYSNFCPNLGNWHYFRLNWFLINLNLLR